MTNKKTRDWCTYYELFDDDKPRRVRCKRCGKMLTSYAVYGSNPPHIDELWGFGLPPHKTKVVTYKRPKGDRRGARARRG